MASGQAVDVEMLTKEQVHRLEPHLSATVSFGLRVRGQRYLSPSAHVNALAERAGARGGKLTGHTTVFSIFRDNSNLVTQTADGAVHADAVILANGAWLGRLASRHGVRVQVRAGRGYGFTLPTYLPLATPLHFPVSRVAVTPAGERVWVVGVTEFADPDAPLVVHRIKSIA